MLGKLSQVIASHMGLHYPRDRWRDLERAIGKAARPLGCKDVHACIRKLLEAPLTESQIEILAPCLTIGETHFFRHEKVFEVLEEQILPEVISARRQAGRRLRIWSAGCATGEEPYSVAMVVRKVIPDLPEWNVTILATDINKEFLRKAERGIYGQWSFRSVPQGIKEAFFTENGEGSEVADAIKAMVTFAFVNLAKDAYPHGSTGTDSMDIVFCRNVMMYFSAEKQQEVVDGLYRSLVDGGRLVVSPAEASLIVHPNLVPLNYPGVIMYRKDVSHQGAVSHYAFVFPSPTSQPSSDMARHGDFALTDPFSEARDAPVEESQSFETIPFAEPRTDPIPQYEPVSWMPPPGDLTTGMLDPLIEEFTPSDAAVEPEITPYLQAVALYDQGRYSEAAEKLIQQLGRDQSPEINSGTAMALLARSYANQGRLDEALKWAEKTVAIDKLNSDYHYLHGAILQEQGRVEEAVLSLRRAVFLEPNLVVAHFALGNIARQQGKLRDSDRHYRIALKILSEYDERAPVPGSEGMTAGRMMNMIHAMTPKEIRNENS
jgi:chemotaxis protein methyltransferase CheR